MTYAVIMAGGVGSRFWPKSTREMPKQFLKLFGDETMIQATVNRLEGFVDLDSCMVVTNSDYVGIVRTQLPGLPDDMVIGEKVAKNTAPCVAAAAAILHKKDPESVMAVLPADHHITKPGRFREILKRAAETAVKEECLVTIGIKPTHPETGYGYINFDKNDNSEILGEAVYGVKQFTEKPDLEKANRFIESGDYLWNSGMFVWKTSVILNAFKKYLPEVFKLTEKLSSSDHIDKEIDQFYQACPSISVDYGIMEKSENVRVVPGEFDWNDVGSWKAVYDLSDKDKSLNALKARHVFIKNSEGNLIQCDSHKPVSIIGIDNVAVVETEYGILVCSLEKAQEVKKAVEYFNQ